MISICFRASTLSAALPSWCRPINALKTVRATSTHAVDQSWMPTTATTAVPRSTSCIRSLYCRTNAFHAGSLASSASLLAPYCAAALLDLGRAQADGRIHVELPTGLVRASWRTTRSGLRGFRCCCRHLRSRTADREVDARAPIDPASTSDDPRQRGGDHHPRRVGSPRWRRAPTLPDRPPTVHAPFMSPVRISCNPPATTLRGGAGPPSASIR